jgi:hypothetical protein
VTGSSAGAPNGWTGRPDSPRLSSGNPNSDPAQGIRPNVIDIAPDQAAIPDQADMPDPRDFLEP